MNNQCYLKSDFVENLYTLFKLFEYRFSKDRTSGQVNNYINTVIPDKIDSFLHTRHIRSKNAKIIYFMNSKYSNHYDMLMSELQDITFFVMTYKSIINSEKRYVSKELIDNIISNFKLDAFSLGANLESKVKDLKIYSNIDSKEIYDE